MMVIHGSEISGETFGEKSTNAGAIVEQEIFHACFSLVIGSLLDAQSYKSTGLQ
jgi:hypothetical protein